MQNQPIHHRSRDPAANALGRRARHAALALIVVALVVCVVLSGPLPQPRSYHAFVDRRPFLGIPNFLNVLSNLPFLLAGAFGFRAVFTSSTLAEPGERRAYLVSFTGVAATALGSSIYHWSPSNGTLLCDRLPITLTFMGLFSAVLGEYVSQRWARRALVPLCVLGVAAALWWYLSERLGVGDLRAYALVQIVPAVVILFLLLFFPAPYSGGRYLALALFLYAVAKLFEQFDVEVFSALGGTLSGHSLKHLAAAAAAVMVARRVARRRRREFSTPSG